MQLFTKQNTPSLDDFIVEHHVYKDFDNADYPKGCFMQEITDPNKKDPNRYKVYFNTHVNGSRNFYARPICKKGMIGLFIYYCRYKVLYKGMKMIIKSKSLSNYEHSIYTFVIFKFVKTVPIFLNVLTKTLSVITAYAKVYIKFT